MKNRYSFLHGKTYALLLAAGTLLWGSCAIGYDSPNGFDVGVSNQQMETPDSLAFTVSVDGTSATISWPLVVGASGYEVSFYNVDDPENPVVVDGYEKRVIDGSQLRTQVTEDSKYRLEIRALGNTAYGNKDDEKPIVHSLSTLVPSIATIPNGSDIYQYLQENPLPETTPSEVAIDLEPNGIYTCSGPVDFGGQKMTFRGDKLKRAVVNMTGSGAFCTYSGLKLKYINFDCSQSTANSFLFMSNANLPEEIKSQNLGYGTKDIYIVEDPIYVSNCWIKDLPKSMIHDNSVNCAYWYFTITDCIIQQRNTKGDPFINLQSKGKCIKHINFNNSTIYNTVDVGGYWVRYNNESNAQQKKVFGSSTPEHLNSTTTFTNCTFGKTFSKNKKMANNYRKSVSTTTISHCIFYDVSGVRQLAAVGVKSFSFNIYYAFTDPDSADPTQIDNSNAPFASVYDPKFIGSVDQSLDLTQPNGGVNFTPQEREVIVNSCGDPRWLPTY